MIGGVAEDRKCLGHALEIRFRVFDNAAELFEDTALTVHHSPNFGLERNSPEAAPPGHPDALEIAVERRAESRAVFLDREWTTRVRTGNGAQEKREVGHRPRQRPLNAQRRPGSGFDRHPPRRGTNSHDIAPGWRV